MAQDPLLHVNLHNETFEEEEDDEEEAIHIPLWRKHERGGNKALEVGSSRSRSSSSSRSSTSSESSALLWTVQDDDGNVISDNNNHHDDVNEQDLNSTLLSSFSPQLPVALILSYFLCGFTLSLQTLPVMYILNTKVPLPLSILPTYGALSFMPYSFKPFYAYVSSFFPRRFLLNVGWTCCAATTLAWMSVQSVPFVFLIGITNNIALSWSSFLLGLTLIDGAASIDHHPSTTAAAATAPALANNSSSHYFEKSASIFQSQAATARNMGSLIASLLTCFIFGMNQSKQQAGLNERVVNHIFFATVGCHIISFLLVLCCEDSFAPRTATTTATTMEFIPQTTTRTTDQEAPQRSSTRSYAALEMSEVEESFSDTSSQEDHDYEQQAEGLRQQQQQQQSTFCNLDVRIIVGLQFLVVALALKKQILYLLHQYELVVAVPAFLSVISLAVYMLRQCRCNRDRARAWIPEGLRKKSWGRLHLVGLVLILRHAVPSPSAVLYSFLYQCFQAQPVWLQVFSLVDNGAVTLASWSYGKLWAPRYSHGYKLITFMMMTTAVSHSTGTLYTALVNYYHNKDGETSINLQSLFPWLVLGIKAVTAFISEWNFLPSVVLATTSLSEPSASSPVATQMQPSFQGSREDNREDATDEQIQPSNVNEPAGLATNIMYGSFISCIDFGDQIGSILSTPLVTALGITRQTNWHNLDVLIFICSGLGVLSAGFLLLLGMDCQQRRGHRHPQ